MAAKKCPVCGSVYGIETVFCANDGARLLAQEEAEKVLGDSDPLVRHLVAGRYRVLKRIGEGGMGMVYLAEHEAIEKRIALKVLKDQYAQREDVVARFQQEARSASRIKHEGVLEVFDFGRMDDGRFFLAMELLDGKDLSHVLEAEGRMEPSRVVHIAIKIARALFAAHSRQVIHRDLKPENVFVRLGDDGREHIKIVDFGIAQLRVEGEEGVDPNGKVSGRKLTKTGMIFGTPEYMSPEQAAGKNIDQRVDVYALGIMLFEMLTGRTPFQGETFMAILTAHLTEPIPTLASCAPPGFYCTSELEAVVRRTLSKDVDSRFRTMNDLIEALQATPEGQVDETIGSRTGRMSMSSPPGAGGSVHPAPNMTDMRIRGPGTPFPASNQASAKAATMVAGFAPGTAGTLEPQTTPGTGTLPGQPPASSGKGIWIGLVAVLVLGGGGFAVWKFALGDKPKKDEPAEVSVDDTKPKPKTSASDDKVAGKPAPSTTPSPTAAPSPVASPAASPTAATDNLVKIAVESTPPGAVVEKEVGKDWLQVCDSTPCDVSVEKGAAVHLRVVKGTSSANKKLLADKDQKAVFTLAATPVAVPAGSKPTGTKKPDLCEVILDEGIKVWRPCAK